MDAPKTHAQGGSIYIFSYLSVSNFERYDTAMRRPTIIILACIAFLIGTIIGYNYLFSPNNAWLVFAIISAIAGIIVTKSLKVIPICCLCLAVGISVITFSQEYRANNGLSGYTYKKVGVIGTVKGDPYWDKNKNYVFILGDVNINGAKREGEVRIKTFSSFAKEGYKVKVDGKVFPILAKPGYQISYAKVEILSIDQPFLVRAKNLLYTGADRAFDATTTGFIKGILVGARSSLPQSAQDTMNAIGLSHIVAVSGYNLTILVVLLQRVLRKKWLWGSLVLSLGLVWSFTLLTGASASIMRAR